MPVVGVPTIEAMRKLALTLPYHCGKTLMFDRDEMIATARRTRSQLQMFKNQYPVL